MLTITAKLSYSTPADETPVATVTGVYDSVDEARGSIRSWERDTRALALAWSRTSRRPRIGEELQTTREASGLVAVVLP